jgi:hypothetical protein
VLQDGASPSGPVLQFVPNGVSGLCDVASPDLGDSTTASLVTSYEWRGALGFGTANGVRTVVAFPCKPSTVLRLQCGSGAGRAPLRAIRADTCALKRARIDYLGFVNRAGIIPALKCAGRG